MNYYGFGTPSEIANVVRRVCSYFPEPGMRYLMICGIIAAESQFGTAKDTSIHYGYGLTQFDPIRYQDVDRNTRQGLRQYVKERLFIDMDLVGVCCLRYSTYLNILYCVLALLRIPEPLPGVKKNPKNYPGTLDPKNYPGLLKEQASYWKRHWNTEAGRGTEDHYIRSYETWKNVIEGDK